MADTDLEVDAGGRTVLASNRAFDHSTRVWHAVIPPPAIPSIIEQCKKCYLKVKTATQNLGIEYETNATYWVGADVTSPSTALEKLALAIFRFHTRGHDGTFDASRSGAEWWTQVVDADKEIAFHWDRDYELQREQGACVHPHLATVTYLTDVGGAPTVVLPAAASPLDADEVAAACHGRLHEAHACWPVAGRHLAFDGRLLHGAPAALVSSSTSTAKIEKRVTLLVNIWLNHIPSGADPLHEAVVRQLKGSPSVTPSWGQPCRAVERRIVPVRGDQLPPAHVWALKGFGHEAETEGHLVLTLPASTQWQRAPRAAAGSFLRVSWGNACAGGLDASSDAAEEEGEEEEEGGMGIAGSLLSLFLHAQGLEEAGDASGAIDANERLVTLAEATPTCTPEPASVMDGALQSADVPPLSLLVALAYGSLGHAHLEKQQQQQQQQRGQSLDDACQSFSRSLQWWPSNASALVKLGDTEHARGNLTAAMRHYEAAAALPPLGEDSSSSSSSSAWMAAWVVEPRREGVALASYMAALLHQMALNDDAALRYLSRFYGLAYRLSPRVWQLAAAGAATTELTATDEPAPKRPRGLPSANDAFAVRRYDSAVPSPLLSTLQEAFGLGAAFWAETNYASRGASSIWYDVSTPPSNAVEAWALQLLQRTGVASKVVGVECCTWPRTLALPDDGNGGTVPTAAWTGTLRAVPRLDANPWQRLEKGGGEDPWAGRLELPATRNGRFFVRSLTEFLEEHLAPKT